MAGTAAGRDGSVAINGIWCEPPQTTEGDATRNSLSPVHPAWRHGHEFSYQRTAGGAFSGLFNLSDEELRQRCAVRTIATGNSPCRISLTDAEPGDELLLVNYEHHPVNSPYRMRFAVYVREGERHFDAVDEIPEQLRRRMLAVRAFDDAGMMIGHELIDGEHAEQAIDRLFANGAAAYLHVHYASPGCYAARVDRA